MRGLSGKPYESRHAGNRLKIVTADQMRELERRSAELGVTTDRLMERAGLEVAKKALALLGERKGGPVLVLIGPGNNGGDGLVAARHLHHWGVRVAVYLCTPRKEEDPQYRVVLRQGIPVAQASQDPGFSFLEEQLRWTALVIDAVLGTGRVRPIEGHIKEVLQRLIKARGERRALKLLALDLPSGLNADTGVVDPCCPQADVTVTLGYPKVGLFSHPGLERVGRLEVVDIGFPPSLTPDVPLEMITAAAVQAVLPPRPLSAHKGTFGRVLVVGGSRHYIGAPYLACMGAVRVGAGLVTLAAPESLQGVLATKLTEVTHLPLPEEEKGVLGVAAWELVRQSLPDYHVLLLGCGLGGWAPVARLVESLLLQELSLPLVLDADGLNHLARIPQWWQRLGARAVLTPHPGEMARLTGKSVDQVQGDRLGTAREWARRWGQVVVLKGAYTVVASPDGQVRVSPFANPGLASAGTGDVLSGVIAGLMAQGLEPFEAAWCGVYLHGAAGERVRGELGEAGMAATDLLPALPRVLKALSSTAIDSPNIGEYH